MNIFNHQRMHRVCMYVCMYVCAAVLFAGCKKDDDDDGKSDEQTPVEVSIDGFSLSNVSSSAITMNEGEEFKIKYEITPAEVADNATVSWKSSDDQVAQVSNSGRIAAVGAGTATITGTCMGLSVSFKVEVKEVVIEDFNVSKTALSTYANFSDTLEITDLKPAKAPAEKISVSVDDPAIATVEIKNKKVIIKGIAIGTTKATLSYVNAKENINISRTIDIEILQPIVNEQVAEFKLDETFQLTANEAVTYESQNTEIAIVNADGVITGVSAGETTIIVTSKNTGKTVTVNVSVKFAVAITPVELELISGETSTLTPTVSGNYVWKSADETVATVDQGGKVTALKPGTTEIAIYLDDALQSKCTVKVISDIEEIALAKKTICLTVGSETQITASIAKPANPTAKLNVTWSVSDESIAKIDANGVVTGLKAGEVTITATDLGGAKATETLIVIPSDYKIAWYYGGTSDDVRIYSFTLSSKYYLTSSVVQPMAILGQITDASENKVYYQLSRYESANMVGSSSYLTKKNSYYDYDINNVTSGASAVIELISKYAVINEKQITQKFTFKETREKFVVKIGTLTNKSVASYDNFEPKSTQTVEFGGTYTVSKKSYTNDDCLAIYVRIGGKDYPCDVPVMEPYAWYAKSVTAGFSGINWIYKAGTESYTIYDNYSKTRSFTLKFTE